jgi:hypothetical protein
MLMRKTMQHVLMLRSPCVLHSVVQFSMACPLLALRGWKQFQMDVLQHDETDQDRLRELVCEGILESFPQLAIGQVSAARMPIVETCCDACVFAVVDLESPVNRRLELRNGPLTPARARCMCDNQSTPYVCLSFPCLCRFCQR